MDTEIRLRPLRDARRLSTRAVAERIGISQSTYMDWERGKSSPSLKLLAPLAEAVEVCPISLVAYLLENITLEELLKIAETKPALQAIACYRKFGNSSKDDIIDIKTEDLRMLQIMMLQNLPATVR